MLKEAKIQIAGKDYLVKKTYRSMLLFEEQTKRPISEMQKSLGDLLLFFYCIVKSNNTVNFDYNQFVDILDKENDDNAENEKFILAIDKFNQFLIDSARTIEEEPQPVKKKVRKSSK